MTEPAARAHKMSLPEMEVFIASFRQRLVTHDGKPCERVDLLLSPEDHFGFEKLQQFLTWLVPYEARLRDIGRKR